MLLLNIVTKKYDLNINIDYSHNELNEITDKTVSDSSSNYMKKKYEFFDPLKKLYNWEIAQDFACFQVETNYNSFENVILNFEDKVVNITNSRKNYSIFKNEIYSIFKNEIYERISEENIQRTF